MYNVIHLGFFSWFSVVIPFDFTDLMVFFPRFWVTEVYECGITIFYLPRHACVLCQKAPLYRPLQVA